MIYLTVTLFGPLVLAIAPPADGAWWILKIVGYLIALFFIGTFISAREYYQNLIGARAYALAKLEAIDTKSEQKAKKN